VATGQVETQRQSGNGAVPAGSGPDRLGLKLREHLEVTLAELPWKIRVVDWTGAVYEVGGREKHWSGHDALELRLTEAAGRDLLGLNAMRFLERFVDGEADMDGNLYLIAEIRNYARLTLRPWDVIRSRLRNRIMESPTRAHESVTSHYDIPEEALLYLDRVYRS
jgi:hypothetical protein